MLSTFSIPATRCCLTKSIISVFRWSICPHDYWWCFIHNKPNTLHSAGATLHTFREFCFECTIKTVYELCCLFLDKWSHLLLEFISFTRRNIHAFLWQWRNWFFLNRNKNFIRCRFCVCVCVYVSFRSAIYPPVLVWVTGSSIQISSEQSPVIYTKHVLLPSLLYASTGLGLEQL